MNILIVSCFHPEVVRGGAQQVAYELFEELKLVPGVTPTFLAGLDPTLGGFYKSGARITGFDGRPGEFLFLTREYDYWWHKCPSPILLDSYAEFLGLVQPDVVHFQHFMMLGLDLISLTRRVLPKARIVLTFHEFLAICAADGQMVRRVDGSLCDRASPTRCHQCFPERRPEEFFTREMWVKRHLSVVDEFTTPSRFLIEHYVRWGLDRNRITHIPNGQRDYSIGRVVTPDRRAKRNRFGFFGQLVDNKGVRVILQAVRILRERAFTDFAVEINGANLQYASEAGRREIEDFRQQEEALEFGDRLVSFNGAYHVDQLSRRMARVDWCMVPSVWWENSPLVISEAAMFGKPVIASNVGGMAERIADGVNGLLFEMGDARSLAEAMRRACTEDGLWDRLVAGITPPPSRDEMVEDYLALYDGERPAPRQPDSGGPAKLRALCLLMQRNERDLLPLWLAYHGALVGHENLVVVDNGSSDPAVLEELSLAEKRGTQVLRQYANEPLSRKGEILGNIIKEADADGRYDAFFPLDCDEFLGVQVGKEKYFDPYHVFREVRRYQGRTEPMAVRNSFYNYPGLGDQFFPWPEKKTFFVSGTFESMDEGFHAGQSMSGEGACGTNIIHVHYHHKPLSLLREHARDKLKEWVDINDDEALRSYAGPNGHLAKYFSMDEAQYRTMIGFQFETPLPRFLDRLRELGLRPPFHLSSDQPAAA